MQEKAKDDMIVRMTAWYSLTLFSLFAYGIQNFLYKVAAEKRCNAAWVMVAFSATTGILGVGFFFLFKEHIAHISLLFWLALIGSAAFVIALMARMEALKNVSASVAYPITRLSTVVDIQRRADAAENSWHRLNSIGSYFIKNFVVVMYKAIRPLLFLMDAEAAHEATLKLAKYTPTFGKPFSPETLRIRLWGFDFPNPVGLAAGFDKNAHLVDALGAFGFGFVEVGTVTPLPQSGNPKPRLFRLVREHALINRMGFNNEGADAVAKRLRARKSSLLVGANIGKNRDTPNNKAVEDYELCFRKLHELVDYIVVNVSSPNTPKLRELQEKQALAKILLRLQEINVKNTPLLLKIAPELTPAQLSDIIEVAQETQLAGIVATNTIQTNEGGLSGKPLAKRSTEVIRYMYQQSQGKIPIIGVGGIFSAQEAYEKIRAGASLVQIYTGLVYEGPGLVQKIKKDLARLLHRDGFSSIPEAVGKGKV